MSTTISKKRIYWFDNFNRYGTIEDNLQLQVNENTEVKLFGDMDEWISYANDNGVIINKEDYFVWHEENMNIQLIFKLEKQAEFIIDNPDFAEKIKLAELPVIIENGFVYIYANYILPEDKEKLENPKYEIIINEKQ